MQSRQELDLRQDRGGCGHGYWYKAVGGGIHTLTSDGVRDVLLRTSCYVALNRTKRTLTQMSSLQLLQTHSISGVSAWEGWLVFPGEVEWAEPGSKKATEKVSQLGGLWLCAKATALPSGKTAPLSCLCSVIDIFKSLHFLNWKWQLCYFAHVFQSKVAWNVWFRTTTKITSHSSGDLKFKIKMSADLVPSEGKSVPCFSL